MFFYKFRTTEFGQTLTVKESWSMESMSRTLNYGVWIIQYDSYCIVYTLWSSSFFDPISIKISLLVCFSTVQMTSNWMDHMKYLTPVGIGQICEFEIFRAIFLHFWSEVHINFEEYILGHEEMHAKMVLVMFGTLFAGQILLFMWRKKHPRSYNLGMFYFIRQPIIFWLLIGGTNDNFEKLHSLACYLFRYVILFILDFIVLFSFGSFIHLLLESFVEK